MEPTPILKLADYSVDLNGAGQIKLSDIQTDSKLVVVKKRLVHQFVEITKRLAVTSSRSR